MKYNFDQETNRYNTSSYKYDSIIDKDILPMWIADMDVVGLKEIKDAILKASENSILGYTYPSDEYYNYLISWYKNHFDFSFSKDDVVMSPGIVYGLGVAIQALTNKNDYIMINEPVYHPFKEMIEVNERIKISSDLVLKDERYELDFNDIEKKIKEYNVKMYVLCSPHNPVGRVWTKEELLKIGEICERNNVYVFADEIHSDFVYSTYKHYTFTNIKDTFKNFTITALAPSKTFNIAGLQLSNIIIFNKEIKEKYKHIFDCVAYHECNSLSIFSTIACYKYGEEWLNEFRLYLENNLNYLIKELNGIKGVKVIKPEGTYLVWLDFRELGLKDKLNDFVLNECKLYLNDGNMFGESGSGFMRMNIACQKNKIIDAVDRIKKALCKYYGKR